MVTDLGAHSCPGARSEGPLVRNADVQALSDTGAGASVQGRPKRKCLQPPRYLDGAASGGEEEVVEIGPGDGAAAPLHDRPKRLKPEPLQTSDRADDTIQPPQESRDNSQGHEVALRRGTRRRTPSSRAAEAAAAVSDVGGASAGPKRDATRALHTAIDQQTKRRKTRTRRPTATQLQESPSTPLPQNSAAASPPPFEVNLQLHSALTTNKRPRRAPARFDQTTFVPVSDTQGPATIDQPPARPGRPTRRPKRQR